MSYKRDFLVGVIKDSQSGQRVLSFIPESLRTLFFEALWEFLLEHGLVNE